MSRLVKYRVLLAGILSPVAALFLYAIVYEALTRASRNTEKDWLFRLSLSTLAMAVPLAVTLIFAMRDRRSGRLSRTAKAGLALAFLSLGLAWKPVSDGILRSRQTRNEAMRDVAAPSFDTVDLMGRQQRLQDQQGKVVLVNIWATWCGPCRLEMPMLDQLYRERKERGLIVFGLSDEDVAVQRRFLARVPVSYPLLTVQGNVPSLYRDIVRYPAIFLIDRKGRLQPAPGPEQPFKELTTQVDALLDGTR